MGNDDLETRVKRLEAQMLQLLSQPTEPRPRAHAKDYSEVLSFVKSVGLKELDAEYIWNLWESNGWTRNGRKILDWKATIRSWKAGGYFPSQRNPQRNGGNGDRPLSPNDIRLKLEAIQKELAQTELRRLDPGVPDRRRKLFDERDRLRKLQTGVL